MLTVPFLIGCLDRTPNTYQMAGIRRGTVTSTSTLGGTTSKVEHRMFSFITKNWRGKPLTAYQVIVDLVAATATETWLRILAEWDRGYYPPRVEVTDTKIAALPLTGHEWHPDRDYNLAPLPAATSAY